MKQSPIFVRTYDLLLWLLPETARWPREHRYSLTRRVQSTAFQLQEYLFEATTPAHTVQRLQAADTELTKLRTYWRLAFDLKLINVERYEHAGRLITEIGRLLGGWRKTA